VSGKFPELPLHPEGESPELPGSDRGAIAAALAASKVGLGELSGAVDLGTNTALLVIGKIEEGALVVVEEHGATPRLGAGLARNGRFGDVAFERTVEVLRHFVERMEINGVAPARRRFVGTAVLRRAEDAERLIVRVREELGVVLEVLPEDEEARLSHAAVVASGVSRSAVVIDVGGGSTELAWDEGERRASIPIGAVVLTETWLGLGGGAPLVDGGWDGLLAAVEGAVAEFPEGIARGLVCVMVGGAAVNLACLDQGLETFDVRLAEGWELGVAAVEESRDRVAALELGARLELAMEPGRAEILPAGLACFGAVLRRIGAERARVSVRGLRHSLLEALALGES
jgi:exopolyphosphatase/guanosine-5'-triphosphate,3'-diphosphate pyrophosphatase